MVYGGGGETRGREGLKVSSLVALTKAEGVSLLPGRDELSGCAGETPSGAGLSSKVGRVSGGCRSTLQAGGALSLFIQSPTPRLFFSFVFVLAGKVGNIVNATLNRKRNRIFFKKKKKKVNCLFVLPSDSGSLFPMLALLWDSKRVVGTSQAVGWCLHAETNFHASVRAKAAIAASGYFDLWNALQFFSLPG